MTMPRWLSARFHGEPDAGWEQVRATDRSESEVSQPEGANGGAVGTPQWLQKFAD